MTTRELVEFIAEAVVFVGLMATVFVYLWLLAPAGAAYPR